MTAIKQVSVCSRAHLGRLESYLDWGRDKALDHGSQNLASRDCRGMFREMDDTREAAGHNIPGKAGCRCTYMQHQVIAFNPDECDINGGKMTKDLCMSYAEEYVRARYPDQEALWVLHRETCALDGTQRYAVHVAINRTNLATGRRLDEGAARKAAASRVRMLREMDARYGLRQMERGHPNSRTHARQPSRAEREWHARNPKARTDNDYIRERVAARASQVAGLHGCRNPRREFEERLRTDGIKVSRSPRGDLRYTLKSRGHERVVNGSTLGQARSKRTGKAIWLDRRGVSLVLRAAREITRDITRETEREDNENER